MEDWRTTIERGSKVLVCSPYLFQAAQDNIQQMARKHTGFTYLSAYLPQKVYFLKLIRLPHLLSFRKLVSVIIHQESCGKIPRKFEFCASWHDHDLLDNICSEFLMTFSCEGKRRKAEITKVPFKVKLPSLHI